MTLKDAPLAYGALAPEFWLTSVDRQTYTRNQFRGKKALVLIFVQPTPEPFNDLFPALAANESEFAELGVLIFGIVHSSVDDLKNIAAGKNLPFTLLADPDGTAWKAYTQQHEDSGYAAFVLDIYGGVDAQQVADTYQGLPDASLILRWTQAAQYKCNI